MANSLVLAIDDLKVMVGAPGPRRQIPLQRDREERQLFPWLNLSEDYIKALSDVVKAQHKEIGKKDCKANP